MNKKLIKIKLPKNNKKRKNINNKYHVFYRIIHGKILLLNNLFLIILTLKDKEKLEIVMRNHIMDNSKIINLKDREHILGIMVRYLLEIGFKEKWMELDNFLGPMAQFIEDNINMIKDMVRVK